MRLYLVETGETRPAAIDPERHLSAKGFEDAVKLADFLKPLLIDLSAVWHSPGCAARETAELLGESLSVKVAERPGLAARDPVWPMRAVVEQAQADLMLVGHQPFLGKLAALLTGAPASDETGYFWFGGIVCLERRIQGGWKVAKMILPHLISAPAAGYAGMRQTA